MDLAWFDCGKSEGKLASSAIIQTNFRISLAEIKNGNLVELNRRIEAWLIEWNSIHLSFLLHYSIAHSSFHCRFAHSFKRFHSGLISLAASIRQVLFALLSAFPPLINYQFHSISVNWIENWLINKLAEGRRRQPWMNQLMTECSWWMKWSEWLERLLLNEAASWLNGN